MAENATESAASSGAASPPASSLVCLLSTGELGSLSTRLRGALEGAGVTLARERRVEQRRHTGQRRGRAGTDVARRERRTIPNGDGRRVAERRAALEPAPPPPLAAPLRPAAAQLRFFARTPPHPVAVADAEAARLVIRAQSGEQGAVKELYEGHAPRVFAYCRAILGDRDEAEDATQDAFERALVALDRFDPSLGAFGAWLSRIARNCAITRLERGRRISYTGEPLALEASAEPGSQAPELPLESFFDEEIITAIARLPLLQRQVLALRYLIDLPWAQVAAELDRSSDAVRQQHTRALRALRGELAGGSLAARHAPAAEHVPAADPRSSLEMRRAALAFLGRVPAGSSLR